MNDDHVDQAPQPASLAHKSNAGKYGEAADKVRILDAMVDLLKSANGGHMSQDLAFVKKAANRFCQKFGASHLTGDDLISIALDNLLEGKKKWYHQVHPHFSLTLVKLMKYTVLEEREKCPVVKGSSPALEIDFGTIEEEAANDDALSSFSDPASQLERQQIEGALRTEILDLVRGDEVCIKIVAYCLDNPREPSKAGKMVLRPREMCKELKISESAVRNAIKRLKRIYAHLSEENFKWYEHVH